MIGIGYPNLLTDSTTVTGGSWNASLPASNVRNTDLSRVARSTNASSGSTLFTVDHGSAVTARGLALVAHNLTASATVQWQRGTSSGAGDVADSSAVAAWTFTPKVRDGKAHQVIVVQSAATSARYDTVRIVDTGNPDGYVEIGAAFVCNLQVPFINIGYGCQDELIPFGSVQRSPAGALWRNARRTLRAVTMALDASPLAEANDWHETLRCASLTEWVLYVSDLEDRAEQQRFGFVGTFSELSAIEYPYPAYRLVPMRLTEVA